MTIFLITKESFPYGMASTNRIKCLAHCFLDQGFDLKLVHFGINEMKLPKSGIIDDIPCVFLDTGKTNVKGRFIKRLRSLYLHILLFRYLFKSSSKGDVVFEYWFTNMFIRTILVRLLHIRKVFYITELCELPYGTGGETNHTVYCRNFVLKHLFPLFDGVVVISDNLKKLAMGHCKSNCVIVKIPILVDFNKCEMANRSDEAAFPYIFHSGTLYEQKDGILGMIEALGIASLKLDIPLHFVSTGSIDTSPHKKEMKIIIDTYNLSDRIHFLGFISSEEIRKQLSYASMVIINKYVNQQNTYCFSTKLAEYMAAEKPIIITRVGEAMNWLSNKKDSFIIEPGDTKELADTIINVLNDKDNSKVVGKAAKELCKHSFDYRCYKSSLANMIEKLK